MASLKTGSSSRARDICVQLQLLQQERRLETSKEKYFAYCVRSRNSSSCTFCIESNLFGVMDDPALLGEYSQLVFAR